MKIKICLFIIGLASSFAAFSASVKVTHMLGEVQLETEPKRVVTIGLGVLDALDAFGITPIAVTKSMPFPDYLQQYKADKYAPTGSLFEPDFEKIYEQKPDVIIIGPRASGSYDELSKIAPTVVFSITDGQGYWAGTQQQWRNLGKIFNITEKVEQKIAVINAEIQSIKAYNNQHNEQTLTVMSAGNKVTTFGAKSRFSAIYQDFAFKEASTVAKPSLHGDLISYEFISQNNPDILFVLDREKLFDREKESSVDTFSNALIRTTKAYQNEKIIMLDLNAWYLGISGVTATEQMIQDVKKALLSH